MNYDKPLGLPEGSVRSIIALAIVATLVGGYFFKDISADTIRDISLMCIGFYFGTRQK